MMSKAELLERAQQHMMVAEEAISDPNYDPNIPIGMAHNYALMATALEDEDVQSEESEQLYGYLIFLLDNYHLWSEDATFTFPDGMTIEKED